MRGRFPSLRKIQTMSNLHLNGTDAMIDAKQKQEDDSVGLHRGAPSEQGAERYVRLQNPTTDCCDSCKERYRSRPVGTVVVR